MAAAPLALKNQLNTKAIILFDFNDLLAFMYVVLDCEAELSRHYSQHQVKRGQFALAQPYGHQGGKQQEAQRCCSPSEAQGDSGGEQRPRKRARKQHTPNAREEEAERRHQLVEPKLQAVLASFQRGLQSMPWPEAKGSQQAAPPEPEPEAATQAAARQPALDLLSLAELRTVVKPKFVFHGADGPPLDLFDRVVENSADEEAAGTACDTDVLVPGRCRFLVSDMAGFRRMLPAPGQPGFDCILLDPPWENASAKRMGTYPTVPSRQLLRLPLPQLLSKAGSLVALWVTNRERHHRFVEQELLPHFGLRRLATWYWLKVTSAGQLVSPLDAANKRPYEPLVLAAPPHWAPRTAIPEFYAVVAVPGQHSRKPHLGRLLAPFLPAEPRCLELFARELARGWSSAGNETLAFQSVDLFEERPSDVLANPS